MEPLALKAMTNCDACKKKYREGDWFFIFNLDDKPKTADDIVKVSYCSPCAAAVGKKRALAVGVFSNKKSEIRPCSVHSDRAKQRQKKLARMAKKRHLSLSKGV